MGESPQVPDGKRILQAQLVVGVLAVGGVIAFFLLYTALDSISDIQRLLIAMCVPPALMGIIVGGYFIVRSGRETD